MDNSVKQSFLDGFLYFFGVGDNPIERHYQEIVRKRKERDAHNEGLSGWEIDARCLRKDWERVGMDIQNAIGQYEHETAKTSAGSN